jgi:hypothetical protein
VKENLKDVSSFDKWLGQQGPYAVGKRAKFFKAWDNRMDISREQEKYAGELQLDTLVGGVMNDYYGRVASETDPAKQSAIIIEANKKITQLTEEGNIPYNLSGKTRKTVNDRFRAITGENRLVRTEERKIAEDDRKLLKEHRDSLSNAKVADGVINLLEKYRPLMQDTPAGTAGNRISEAVADVHKLEGYTDIEKLAVLKEAIPRLRSISKLTIEEDKQVRALEKSVKDAEFAARRDEESTEKHEIALEDQEFQRLDRQKLSRKDAAALGRNITANRLYNDMIDLLADGVPYETAYATITQQANKNLSDRTVITSLETSLKGLKPADKRTSDAKRFDERMTLLRVGDKSVQDQIFDVEQVIQMEIDANDLNPIFYDYTAGKKEAQAIEQAFHNLMLADPGRIHQEIFREEFMKFVLEGDGKSEAEIEESLKNSSKVYKIPVRMLLYIIYGRDGYEELIKQEYAK